jgi:LPXTG-motif cell wall-anchored protein
MSVVCGSRLRATWLVAGIVAGTGWLTPAAWAGLLVDGFHPRPTHVVPAAAAVDEPTPAADLPGFGPYQNPGEPVSARPTGRSASLRQALVKQLGPAVVSLFFFPPPSPPPAPPPTPPPPSGDTSPPPDMGTPAPPPPVVPPPPPPTPPPPAPPPPTDPLFPPPPRDTGIPPDHPTTGSDTPEPATLLSGLLGSGMAGLVVLVRRKRRHT